MTKVTETIFFKPSIYSILAVDAKLIIVKGNEKKNVAYKPTRTAIEQEHLKLNISKARNICSLSSLLSPLRNVWLIHIVLFFC